MKYFLLVWVAGNLLFPAHPSKFSTLDDCGSAAMLAGNTHAGTNEGYLGVCYDQNGVFHSAFARGHGIELRPGSETTAK